MALLTAGLLFSSYGATEADTAQPVQAAGCLYSGGCADGNCRVSTGSLRPAVTPVASEEPASAPTPSPTPGKTPSPVPDICSHTISRGGITVAEADDSA